MPVVSVIVPVYNGAEYLPACLDSILGQTVEELEVLCVDDGSEDASLEICRAYARRDRRVKVLRQENGGAAAARNRGMDHARGEWLCFVDADDWLAPTMLEELLGGVRDGETDLVLCNYCRVDETGRKKENRSFGRDEVWDRARIRLELRKFLCPGVGRYGPYGPRGFPWGRIYRRERLERYAVRFPTALRRGQDEIFNLYAYWHSRSITYLHRPLYYYRVLPQSVSHRFYPHIAAVMEEDFRQVSRFARRYQGEDPAFARGIPVRICIFFYRCLAYCYFRPEYLRAKGYRAARREALALRDSPVYREAYEQVDLSLMGWQQRVFVCLAKWRWMDALYLAVQVKRFWQALR